MRDMKNLIDTPAVPTLNTAAQSATGTAPDAGVDLRGYDSAMFVVAAGAIVSSGLFYPKAVESDDNSTWTDVAAADLEGSFLTTGMATNDVYRVGYKGSKRYVGIVPVKISGTSTVMTAVVLRGKRSAVPAP